MRVGRPTTHLTHLLTIPGDSVCIICREEMRATGASKRLPCTHMFHVNCLRSWFQRQQTCPTCRRDILSLASQRAAAAAAAAGGAPQQAPQGAQAPAQPPAGAQQQPPNQNVSMGVKFCEGWFL
jgi:E3 ubiquitin-protein ligase synoviolin